MQHLSAFAMRRSRTTLSCVSNCLRAQFWCLSRLATSRKRAVFGLVPKATSVTSSKSGIRVFARSELISNHCQQLRGAREAKKCPQATGDRQIAAQATAQSRPGPGGPAPRGLRTFQPLTTAKQVKKRSFLGVPKASDFLGSYKQQSREKKVHFLGRK